MDAGLTLTVYVFLYDCYMFAFLCIFSVLSMGLPEINGNVRVCMHVCITERGSSINFRVA